MHLHNADRDQALSPVGEKVADRRTLTTEPGVEDSGREYSFEETRGRERGNRRAGLLLVLVGVALMSLAAAEASASEDGAPGTPASGEARVESAEHSSHR